MNQANTNKDEKIPMEKRYKYFTETRDKYEIELTTKLTRTLSDANFSVL